MYRSPPVPSVHGTFPKQEYWSGLPFPPPEGLSNPEIKPEISCIDRWILYHWATWEALWFCISWIQFSRSVVSDSLQPHGLQQTRLPCLSPTPGAYSNSCPLRWWCHPAISSSVVHFSSHIRSFPASGSFPVSQFLASGDQSIGVSASTPVLPMNIQDWSPLGWTGWISSQSKGLSRVFSNTTVQKHQFFGIQLCL